jgi:beta-lactamase superfamily II metal-dependent hydrolase
MRSLSTAILLLASVSVLPAARKNLEVLFIDVEGGQATLLVAPSGESMLIDTGWAGFNNRDAERIAAAAKSVGVKKIDWLVVTHYHSDHVGGVPQLAAKMPIGTFVDHGATTESGKNADVLWNAYIDFRNKGKHLEVKAGDTIPVKGLDIKVLAAAGQGITVPLPGAGGQNPLCASFKPKAEDKSENARSVGMLITYGKFRIIDLGDLTWNKESELVCPENRIGTIDVYLTTHHGLSQSNPEVIVHALHPRVAIMNNGAKKGGSPETWQIVRKSPGLIDLWQLHYSIAGGKENNSPDSFIANVDDPCEGKWIKLVAQQDGTFTVTNSRNKYEKTYKP